MTVAHPPVRQPHPHTHAPGGRPAPAAEYPPGGRLVGWTDSRWVVRFIRSRVGQAPASGRTVGRASERVAGKAGCRAGGRTGGPAYYDPAQDGRVCARLANSDKAIYVMTRTGEEFTQPRGKTRPPTLCRSAGRTVPRPGRSDRRRYVDRSVIYLGTHSPTGPVGTAGTFSAYTEFLDKMQSMTSNCFTSRDQLDEVTISCLFLLSLIIEFDSKGIAFHKIITSPLIIYFIN